MSSSPEFVLESSRVRCETTKAACKIDAASLLASSESKGQKELARIIDLQSGISKLIKTNAADNLFQLAVNSRLLSK